MGVLALAGLGWWWASTGDAWARIRSSGTIRIGYAVEAPYAMVAADGHVTGESPELARLVVQRMGIADIEWIQTSFDALLTEVSEGRFDVVAAGVFITPQREKIVAFSTPTVRVSAGLGVREGTRRFDSYAALVAAPAARVGVLSGSLEESRLLGRGLSEARLLRVPDAVAAHAALESGKVDALALSLPTLRRMVSDGAKFAVTRVAGRAASSDAPMGFDVGFVFAQGETRMRKAWNAAQAEVKGGPEHLAAIAPFGFSDADLAGSTPK